MERSRGGRTGLLWAVLVSPSLTADRIGLNEPPAPWQQLAGPAVIGVAVGVAVGVARRRPLAAFASVAALTPAATPSLGRP
ncbi:hypothetical protein [Streptomyces sp. bgisy034]|uniref:hypothetical protein n=1 Tax=Streptomyces sp. bgisy034 TaxID=3413774 RepID=UPI003EBC3A24